MVRALAPGTCPSLSEMEDERNMQGSGMALLTVSARLSGKMFGTSSMKQGKPSKKPSSLML
eukprot:5758704-Pleurochrysis_carterae.AAC.2